MLILQFLDALEELDDRLGEGENLHVWLVIRDRVQFESAAGGTPTRRVAAMGRNAIDRNRPDRPVRALAEERPPLSGAGDWRNLQSAAQLDRGGWIMCQTEARCVAVG